MHCFVGSNLILGSCWARPGTPSARAFPWPQVSGPTTGSALANCQQRQGLVSAAPLCFNTIGSGGLALGLTSVSGVVPISTLPVNIYLGVPLDIWDCGLLFVRPRLVGVVQGSLRPAIYHLLLL